jgi:hypothetical protein
VSAAGFRVATRQRHVEVAELVDLKALADRFDAAEGLQQLAQPVGGEAEHLDVDVRRVDVGTHQAVAHPAAHDQRASPCVAYAARDLCGVFERRHCEVRATRIACALTQVGEDTERMSHRDTKTQRQKERTVSPWLCG